MGGPRRRLPGSDRGAHDRGGKTVDGIAHGFQRLPLRREPLHLPGGQARSAPRYGRTAKARGPARGVARRSGSSGPAGDHGEQGRRMGFSPLQFPPRRKKPQRASAPEPQHQRGWRRGGAGDTARQGGHGVGEAQNSRRGGLPGRGGGGSEGDALPPAVKMPRREAASGHLPAASEGQYKPVDHGRGNPPRPPREARRSPGPTRSTAWPPPGAPAGRLSRSWGREAGRGGWRHI